MMKLKVAFVLLLVIEVVFSAYPISDRVNPYIERARQYLRDFRARCKQCQPLSKFDPSDNLCAKVIGVKLTLPNNFFNCLRYKCGGRRVMQFLYMGNCYAPVPSTGHVFTEPKLPFVPNNPNNNNNPVNPYHNNAV